MPVVPTQIDTGVALFSSDAPSSRSSSSAAARGRGRGAVQVMISYSAEDQAVADAACEALESHGLRCWIAPRDILPGREWGGAIMSAISNARVMVLIYTARSNESPHVRREVERAVARGLHVIPVRLEDVPMSPTLEYFISAPHWLDALHPPLGQHFERLAVGIHELLDDERGPDDLTAPADEVGEDAAWAGARAAGRTSAMRTALFGMWRWVRGAGTPTKPS